MKKNMIFTLAAAAVFTLCAQDSVTEFKKGTGQLNARKYAAAAETFDKIAQTSSGEMKEKALLYKAIAMGWDTKLKKEAVQPAVDAIQNAKLKSYAAMHMLYRRNLWKDVVEKFAEEKIQEWPEDYAYLGWLMRGSSRNYRRLYEQGIEDLLLAEKNVGSDKEAYLQIEGSLFHAYSMTKKYNEAIAAIERIRAEKKTFGGSYLYLSPVLSSVNIYILLKKYDEAHKILADLQKLSSANNVYGCRYFMALGSVFRAEGKTAEAKEAYQKACDCKNAPKYYRDLAQKALDSLK